MRRLPPFAPLVAFEAVARLGSFTAAAMELLLTQSAISHRVRQLETHLGRKLFERLNPGLELTSAGTSLLKELTPLLAGLERINRPRIIPLRLGAGVSVISWWLARRLTRFANEHPDIALEIVPFVDVKQAEETPVDLRMLWVLEEHLTHREDQRIFPRETVFPVCHPKLLDGTLLEEMPLIHKGSAEADWESGREWAWETWFARDNIPAPRLRFRDIGSALAAAADGLGVVLGRSLLVHDALADGRLVRALPPESSLPSVKVHVLRWRQDLKTDPRLKILADWLLAEATQSLADLEAKPALMP